MSHKYYKDVGKRKLYEKEYNKKYYELHKEKIRKQRSEYHKKYYLKNKKRILERNKKWDKENPQKRRIIILRHSKTSQCKHTAWKKRMRNRNKIQ
jgi:hypothetical protein